MTDTAYFTGNRQKFIAVGTLNLAWKFFGSESSQAEAAQPSCKRRLDNK
jgi:hypothetical protein